MIKYLQLPTCKLAEFISESTTTFTVAGFLLNDGVTPVATTDIGDICFASLEPKTPREELISFVIDSVTAEGVATITATRGLLQKSPYTVGGATFDHQNGSDLVISNNPGLFNQLTAKDNDETITGNWNFPEPTQDNNPATKAYADAIASLGGPEATNLTRGLTKLSSSPQVILGTATISIAAPAVISFVGHGLIEGDSIKFTTTGALPTGLTAGNTYFVLATDLIANTFKLSATLGGTAITTTGSQSGVHTLSRWTPVAMKSDPDLEDALEGGGDFGEPSAANKFATEQFVGVMIPKRTVYEVSGSPHTWNKPANLSFIEVELWGAGASGVAYRQSGGELEGKGGGGGGAYKKIRIKASDLGSTETITVGAGGAAVSATVNGTTNGNAGADSSFGSHITAPGGAAPNNRSGGNGGAVLFDYGTGGLTTETASINAYFGGGGGGRGASSKASTPGGQSIFGGGGGGGCTDDGNPQAGGQSEYGGDGGAGGGSDSGSFTATSGSVPGGGGGAAHSLGGTATSGAGGNGRIIVTEYYA